MPTTDDIALRRAFGAFATGVAIVSAMRADGRYSGLTVNSLSSVSMSPPLLLWCLADTCVRYDTFASAETWGVNVLRADQREAALKHARAVGEEIAPEEADLLHGAPVLRSALARFVCATYQRHIAGDHTVIIGEVIGYDTWPGEALTFYRGQYHSVADRTDI